jgi:hypothetical protein
MHDLILTEPVELVGMLKSTNMLILTEPVELVGMLKSQLKCTILLNQWVGGNAKITTQMHDILILTEPGVGGNAKITT